MNAALSAMRFHVVHQKSTARICAAGSVFYISFQKRKLAVIASLNPSAKNPELLFFHNSGNQKCHQCASPLCLFLKNVGFFKF